MGVGGLKLGSTWHQWLLAWPHDTISGHCQFVWKTQLGPGVKGKCSSIAVPLSRHLLTCVSLYCVLCVIIIAVYMLMFMYVVIHAFCFKQNYNYYFVYNIGYTSKYRTHIHVQSICIHYYIITIINTYNRY